MRGLEREGFRHVHILTTPEEVEAAAIERQPLWNNRKSEHGPFDIIGDVHGCFDELLELLVQLEYEVSGAEGGSKLRRPREGVQYSWGTWWIAVQGSPACFGL